MNDATTAKTTPKLAYARLSSERYTPFSLAKKLDAIAILESASFTHGRERYSILMLEKAFEVRQNAKNGDAKNSEVEFVIEGKKVAWQGDSRTLEDSPCGAKNGARSCLDSQTNLHAKNAPKNPSDVTKLDILDALAYISAQNHRAIKEHDAIHDAIKDIPLPSAGVGFLGYEFCAFCDEIALFPQKDELDLPLAAFIVGHIYVVFDHFCEELHIFGLNYNEHSIDLEAAISRLKNRINDLDFSYLQPASQSEDSPPVGYKILSDISATKAAFIANVEQIKRHITAGDLLQAVPSKKIRIECATSALNLYGKLRLKNPSPYLFYINFGSFELVGASPESLVRVRDWSATIRPIAGTRRRGKSEAEDEFLRLELLNDPKEKAEHLMLVDLARNDLGRVCAAGSVRVEKFMDCERFSSVTHLVSEVRGTIEADKEAGGKNDFGGTNAAIAALRAAFPAGTVSGAPKIRAIEIISSLESHKRGFYAGAVGYFDIHGGFDFCIAIRCALKKAGIWTLQAGAGVVYDSTPEREWEETNEKINAIYAVLCGESLGQKSLDKTAGQNSENAAKKSPESSVKTRPKCPKRPKIRTFK